MEVFVVTYWDKDTEPTITVFSDETAANKAKDYFSKEHEFCILDKVPVYKSFTC